MGNKPRREEYEDVFDYYEADFAWKRQQTRRKANEILEHWYVKRGGTSKRELMDLYCRYCDWKLPYPLNLKYIKRRFDRGQQIAPCYCRAQQRIRHALNDILAPGWAVCEVNMANKKQNVIVCRRGHERRVTLDQARADAKASDDGLLYCKRCMRTHGTMEAD